MVLPVLERRLLVLRRGEHLVLHGLQEDFVRLECPNAPELEAALIDSYRAERGAGSWSSVSDDGYILDHLIAHLSALGLRDELLATVDAGWVRRQSLRRNDLGQVLDDVRLALDVAADAPMDVSALARLGILAGQVSETVREAPALLAGALAEIGDVDQALRWAADKPDPQDRFEALVVVAEGLCRRGELRLAERVVRTTVAAIPRLGRTVETGMFEGLTAMNAVHALVDFPAPDEWEGTTPQLVALARIPLDAIVRLAPVAHDVGSLAQLAGVSHPFWELYGHLLPIVAVEVLADGRTALAEALLDAGPQGIEGDDDPAEAWRYRRAVALAAVGRFEEARGEVDALPPYYHPVGSRGLARHLAARGHAEEALDAVGRIEDPTVADMAMTDVVNATLADGEPTACWLVAEVALQRDWLVAGAWLLAAGGDPSLGHDLLGRAERDDARLGFGVRFGELLRRGGHYDEAAAVANGLVEAAVRLLGPQWFAPETVGAEPGSAELANGLLALVARTGEPLPDGVTPLAMLIESQWEVIAGFKLSLLVQLVLAGRFAEARTLAGWSATAGGRALYLATVLSVADDAVPADERRDAGDELIAALEEGGGGSLLDAAVGAVVRRWASAGLETEAARLVALLPSRPGLWSGIGVWATELRVARPCRRRAPAPSRAAARSPAPCRRRRCRGRAPVRDREPAGHREPGAGSGGGPSRGPRCRGGASRRRLRHRAAVGAPPGPRGRRGDRRCRR